MEVIVKYNGDISALEVELGVGVEILSSNYAIITLRQDQIAQLYQFPQIQYVELPKILTFSLTESLYKACIPSVQENPAYNLLGKGVLVAIIDSGVDYTHPDFRNPDGSSRILYIWDQTASGTPPIGFTHGAEFDNDQLNAALASASPFALVPQTDSVGHGTAVAGIAVGNGRASGGREKGVAPQASIIAVRLGHKGSESFARTTEIMRAFKYVFDKATLHNMPLAVNLSYGTNNGSHDGNSLFETYINEMSQKYKAVIVVASGNEGSAGHHYSARIKQGEQLIVEFATARGLSSFFITLWKNFVDTFTLEFIWPNGRSSGVLYPENRFRTSNTEGATLSVFYGQPTHYNVDQEIFFLIEGQIPHSIWKLIVNGVQVTDGRFSAWLPTIEEVTKDTAFLLPTVNTTLTLPSTARNVLTVGGYNAILNSISDFSGRGFTRNDVYAKPDITAPAVNIISARANSGGYDSFTGTSMATPFVTGAAALMMEWGIVRGNDPFLYGQRIKAFLHKSANRKADLTYPNPSWGYGTLCVQAAIDYLVNYNGGNPYGL